ncbi:MAG: PHB depolymerase family esterase [Aquabacterium sp.]|nr:PHB depolymerase family esterase [Aquabacterium sp.]
MSRRLRKSPWAKLVERSVLAFTRSALKSGSRGLAKALKPAVARRTPPPGDGAWLPGVALGAAGALRFRLYRPPGVQAGERLPMMVMLHGCGQDANGFAASTRMNRVAQRERFLVLYPEQDRLRNPQGCWNWYDTSSGRAFGEAALILKAIDQVCQLYPADRTRVVIAGLSAGASMAALLAARHPDRFKAVVMHSGIPPGTAHSGLSALGAMHGHRATRPLAATPAALWPPLLVIHGQADAVVSPHNGRAAAQVWADAAGATPGAARRVQRGARYPMSVTDFKRRGSIVATLALVDRLGHAWSGGAASQPFSDARGPDASRLAWAFAAKQLRAQAGR